MHSNIPNNWYQTFFHGLVVDLWQAAIPPEQTQAEVDFLVAELHAPPGGKLIDIPCGGSRHAIELARRGYRVTGLDISPEFLAAAKASAEARGVPLELREADMATLKLPPASCDGLLSLGNSFGYIADTDTSQFLATVAGALRPGARLIFDTGVAAELLLPHLDDEMAYEFGGVCVTSRHGYDMHTSRMATTYTLERNGEVQTRSLLQHVYTIREIVQRVEAAGLRIVALYGSIAREPLELKKSRSLYVVAER